MEKKIQNLQKTAQQLADILKECDWIIGTISTPIDNTVDVQLNEEFFLENFKEYEIIRREYNKSLYELSHIIGDVKIFCLVNEIPIVTSDFQI